MKSIKSFIGIALIGLMLATAIPSHASPVRHQQKTEFVCHNDVCINVSVSQVSPVAVYLNVPAPVFAVSAAVIPTGPPDVVTVTQDNDKIYIAQRTMLNDARPPNLTCRVDNRRSSQVHPQLLQIKI